MSRDEAGTRFQDGMRVATEHMRHMQPTAAKLWEAGRGQHAHGFDFRERGAPTGDALRDDPIDELWVHVCGV